MPTFDDNSNIQITPEDLGGKFGENPKEYADKEDAFDFDEEPIGETPPTGEPSDEYLDEAEGIVETFDFMMSGFLGFLAHTSDFDKYGASPAKKKRLAKLWAKILRKYEALVSVEYMLIACILSVYTPLTFAAYKSGQKVAKKPRKKKRDEQEIQDAEIVQE